MNALRKRLRLIDGSGQETLFTIAGTPLPKRRNPRAPDAEWWGLVDDVCRDFLATPKTVRESIAATMGVEIAGISLPRAEDIYGPGAVALMLRLLAGDRPPPHQIIGTLRRALLSLRAARESIEAMPTLLAKATRIWNELPKYYVNSDGTVRDSEGRVTGHVAPPDNAA